MVRRSAISTAFRRDHSSERSAKSRHTDLAIWPSSSVRITRTVTPAWAMNVSSEAFRPNLVAIPIEHRQILYVDFFDALDARLGLNTPAR
jgi:apolipoprotein N-acyltransferase